MTNIEAIKEKLRKLIAKENSARDIGNVHEAEAFASKIQELMLAYELEMDDVMKGQGRRVYNVDHELFDPTELLRGHEGSWVYMLYNICARSCFCSIVIQKRRLKDDEIHIFGEDTNRELLHYMTVALINKLRPYSRKAFSEYTGSTKRNTFIRSFFTGAAMGIKAKLRQQEKHDYDANQQVAGLVLNKMAAVELFEKDFFKSEGGTVTAQKARRPGSTDGFMQGHAVGSNMSINKGMGGSTGSTKSLN
jgi:hypothetical protein